MSHDVDQRTTRGVLLPYRIYVLGPKREAG
jgi:hypothetical protein